MAVLKKQHIIDITINLFAQHGISNVSIEMIAKELGASKGKVYHYFKRGKIEIVTEILKIFERYAHDTIRSGKKNRIKNADTTEALCSLFLECSAENSYRMRKIIRIIMSEMYYNAQIAQCVVSRLINEREKMLTSFFDEFVDTRKIEPFNAENLAMCLNRLILVSMMEDVLQYPYMQDELQFDKRTRQIIANFTNMVTQKSCKSIDQHYKWTCDKIK